VGGASWTAPAIKWDRWGLMAAAHDHQIRVAGRLSAEADGGLAYDLPALFGA